jgi:hypothetical protein
MPNPRPPDPSNPASDSASPLLQPASMDYVHTVDKSLPSVDRHLCWTAFLEVVEEKFVGLVAST